MPRFTSENNPRKNHPNSKVRRRPADLGTTAGDSRSAMKLVDQILDEQPTDQVTLMAERMKFSPEASSLPYPEGPRDQTVAEAESELFELQQIAAEALADLAHEQARIEAAKLAARRNLDAARERQRQAEAKQRALDAPRRLAEANRKAEAEQKEKDRVRLSEANVYRTRLLQALEPVRRELVGVQTLADEWLGPLKKLDEMQYEDLPATWSQNGRGIIARQRTQAAKIRTLLVNTLQGIKTCIRDGEAIAKRFAPKNSAERLDFNTAMDECKRAGSGHTAYLTNQITGIFTLINDVVEKEGGGLVLDDATIATPDRIGRNTNLARIEKIRKAPMGVLLDGATEPINNFEPHDAEPEQTYAERGPLPTSIQ